MEIKITEKTNFEGVTYYYLYIDNVFTKLSRDLNEIKAMVEVAKSVFASGKHIESVIEIINL
jgi:hypothetical protein